MHNANSVFRRRRENEWSKTGQRSGCRTERRRGRGRRNLELVAKRTRKTNRVKKKRVGRQNGRKEDE